MRHLCCFRYLGLVLITFCVALPDDDIDDIDIADSYTPEEDHEAFLGLAMKAEFDDLPLEEAKRRLRLLVPSIDSNKDGMVDHDELETWMRHKQAPWETGKEDVGEMFRSADRNFDHVVDWEEYSFRRYGFHSNDSSDHSEMLKKHYHDLLSRDLRRWKYADTKGDGALSRNEFEMFRHPTEHKQMMPVVAMEELEEADTDNDGYVSLEEYIASIHMPAMRRLDERAFREKYDINHDGKLDVSEVEIWKTPEDFDRATLEAKHLIRMADDNKDGLLTSEEIVLHHFVFVGSKATQSGLLLHDEF